MIAFPEREIAGGFTPHIWSTHNVAIHRTNILPSAVCFFGADLGGETIPDETAGSGQPAVYLPLPAPVLQWPCTVLGPCRCGFGELVGCMGQGCCAALPAPS